MLGGAPFAPWMPRILRDEYGIKGVLNLCDEVGFIFISSPKQTFTYVFLILIKV